jgi:acylphosphatase
MDSDRAQPLGTRLVRVRGRVQGIGYRHACIQQARALGVTGWVRNRTDDSVEALLQGPLRQVVGMCEWMRDAVPSARVDAIEVTEVQAPVATFDGFEQRPSV